MEILQVLRPRSTIYILLFSTSNLNSFCVLKPYLKFQSLRTTPSGRQVIGRERWRRRNKSLIGATFAMPEGSKHTSFRPKIMNKCTIYKNAILDPPHSVALK